MQRSRFLIGRLATTVLLSVVSTTALAVVAVSNGIYEVRVQETVDGFTSGSWTAFTGAGHPTGPGNDLLFAQTELGSTQSTNFSSLRVYTPGGIPADYTFGGSGGGIDLDPYVTTEGASPIAGIVDGWRTVWDVTPEALRITQDVVVVGGTFANSAIYHTVEITNTGPGPVLVGWRNLYDWQVDEAVTDDGPSNQVETSDGAIVVPGTTTEFSHAPAAGEVVRVSADPGVPTYEPLLGIGLDPGFLPDFAATVPDEYAYVSWPDSFGTAFDYTIGPGFVSDDSAGLSWFGRDLGRAIALAMDSSVRFTQVIFGVTPDAPPPGRDIPEPTTLALFGIGLFGLRFRRRPVCRAESDHRHETRLPAGFFLSGTSV